MVKLNNGIPFEIKIPNKDTLKAMQEAKEFKGEKIIYKNHSTLLSILKP